MKRSASITVAALEMYVGHPANTRAPSSQPGSVLPHGLHRGGGGVEADLRMPTAPGSASGASVHMRPTASCDEFTAAYVAEGSRAAEQPWPSVHCPNWRAAALFV